MHGWKLDSVFVKHFSRCCEHPIPKGAAGPMGWWYVFGSASLTLAVVQILTGIGLALVYVPAADKAYESLLYLNFEQPLGWFLRALHYYAGSGMVVMVAGAHDAGVPARGVQVSARIDVGGWACFCCCVRWACSSPARCCAGIRMPTGASAVGASMAGRVPVLGPAPRASAARRPGHRRRHAEPILRPARVRHPRHAVRAVGGCTCGWCCKGVSEPPVAGPGRSIRRLTMPSTRRS